MEDIVIDTNILGEFLQQYFQNKIHSDGVFVEGKFLNNKIVVKLNSILHTYRANNSFDKGLVIVSSFAFIELSRKFLAITEGKVTVDQLRAFISEPPIWFVISEIDEGLVTEFVKVPKYISIDEKMANLEWADAIHCATYYSRDSAKMATSDAIIKLIKSIEFVT